MRILIPTVGSHGDVHPFLAVGQALASRGHDVTVAVQSFFEAQVRAAGLGFFSVGERFEMGELANRPELMNGMGASIRVMRDLVIPGAPEFARIIEHAIRDRGVDLVFTHHICFGAVWAAERTGTPCATACLTPIMWSSLADPGATSPLFLPKPNTLGARLQAWVTTAGCRWFYDGPLNKARRELGLPARRDEFLRPARSSDAILGLWSPAFRPPMPADPPRARVCGFAFFDHGMPGEATRSSLAAFLDAGDPPIVFTLGSSAVHVAGVFYEAAAGACRILNRRGLLLIGSTREPPRNLPPGVIAVAAAPHSLVMPRACATVHHGGVGTTAQALRAGRPTLVVPFAHDQFDNATRATRLGVGATIARRSVTAQSLAAALGSILSDAAIVRRAADLGARISSEDGASAAADTLEQLVTTGVQASTLPMRG